MNGRYISRALGVLVIVIAIGAGIGIGYARFVVSAASEQAAGTPASVANVESTRIRPADVVVNHVAAAGNIELLETTQVVAKVDGFVEEVLVEVGDVVGPGTLLVALDREDLRRAVELAQISLTSAELQLENLLAASSATELAAAEADLKSAQENLAELLDGVSSRELAAARSSAASAWARYNSLLDGPSDNERIQLVAAVDRARVDMQEAQRAYDKVAWRNDVGMTQQAAHLQQMTITYGSAVAAYEEAVEPASSSDVYSALSQAESAQDQLDSLLAGPTAANLAAAEAQVAAAQSRLDTLLRGADEPDIKLKELEIKQARLALQEASVSLVRAEMVAPAAGTVLSVNVEASDRVSAGTVAITLADLSQLQLTVRVAEVDIPKVGVGQLADVTIDAFPNSVFAGMISNVDPVNEAEQGVISYPVTVRLIDESLTDVLPGMTAVATLRNVMAEASWLVPTAAIQEIHGETVVMVTNGDEPQLVTVTAEGVQGEWTVVRSAQLQGGDEVMGTTTFVSQEEDWVPFSGPPPNAIRDREN